MARLAIVGGGASGLIAAHWLQHRFDITVFEKRSTLGGNVQTINRNIASDKVPTDLKLETGVLGFHKDSAPILHGLLDELETPLRTGRPTASLYRQGHYYPSNLNDLVQPSLLLQLLKNPSYLRGLSQLRADYTDSFRRITRWSGETEPEVRSLYGSNETLNDFIQSLLALAFSTPFDEAGDLPASLARQYLKTLRHPDWTYVADGVYAYLDRIVSKPQFKVETDCDAVKVERPEKGVSLKTKGQTFAADAVLLAVTPGEILNILEDPNPQETALFDAWSDRDVETLLHTDTSFYAPFEKSRKTPMDLFVNHGAAVQGYNTSLNAFCGLETKVSYSFALGLDDIIRPDTILHRTQHRVPNYTVAAMRTRDQIRRYSGQRNTYFAGAWLYNGLHEGAAQSARITADHLLSSVAI